MAHLPLSISNPDSYYHARWHRICNRWLAAALFVLWPMAVHEAIGLEWPIALIIAVTAPIVCMGVLVLLGAFVFEFLPFFFSRWLKGF